MKWFYIPNLIVLPCILIGGYLTNNWLWMGILFLIGALMFNRNKWGGGDVKLLALIGGFMGGWAILSMAISIILLRLYRTFMNKKDERLPYAPFLFVSSILTIGTTKLLHGVIL
jgi:prepilin signal peptidase PulO-like enzyme (type II secretory pathway)